MFVVLIHVGLGTFKKSSIWFSKKSQLCEYYRTETEKLLHDSQAEYDVIYNLVPSETAKRHHGSDVNGVTVVTQGSVNNLSYLISMSRRWQNPISVAVFAPTDDDVLAAGESICKLRHCFFTIRQHVSFHLVRQRDQTKANFTTLVDFQHCGSDIYYYTCKTESFCRLPNCENNNFGEKLIGSYRNKNSLYPVNFLRNVAMDGAFTEYVFVLDIDMVVSANLHQDFLQFLQRNHSWTNRELEFDDDSERKAYVVPVFEMEKKAVLPENKQELIQLMAENVTVIRPFYVDICPHCHSFTNYGQWLADSSEEMRVIYQVVWHNAWEPYYIAKKGFPKYDERFRGYGFNRISQVRQKCF